MNGVIYLLTEKCNAKEERKLFEDYDIKVVQVLRNYSMLDRKEAPTDSFACGCIKQKETKFKKLG